MPIMYLQYVKQVWAVVRVALAKVAGKLFFSRGTLPLKAKPIAKINDQEDKSTSFIELSDINNKIQLFIELFNAQTELKKKFEAVGISMKDEIFN